MHGSPNSSVWNLTKVPAMFLILVFVTGMLFHALIQKISKSNVECYNLEIVSQEHMVIDKGPTVGIAPPVKMIAQICLEKQ